MDAAGIVIEKFTAILICNLPVCIMCTVSISPN